MSAQTTHQIQPVVSIVNNQPITNSLNVAEVFGKSHNDVLKAIRSLDVPDEFNEGNFPLVDYLDAKGEKRPMHNLTRDGFTILVMGFTGPKAMKFKLAYIDAFNRMEAELVRQRSELAVIPRTEGEILKSLVATNQALTYLHERLTALAASSAEIASLKTDFKNLGAYTDRLTNLSMLEHNLYGTMGNLSASLSSLKEDIALRRKLDQTTTAQLMNLIQGLERRFDQLEVRLEAEERARSGLMGFMEANLPKYDLRGSVETRNITADNDPARFLRECCEVDPFASVEISFLYKIYKAWACNRYVQPLGPVLFADYIQARLPEGVTVKLRKSKQTLEGLKPCPSQLNRA